MKLYLVRHAKAEPRRLWKGKDLLRPLSGDGQRQAGSLARLLEGAPLARIVSGPALCCQQTVEPLSNASDIGVDVDERLGEGEGVQRALELLPAYGEGPVLYCTHGEVIPDLLRLFELADGGGDGQIPCRKGSVWVLEGPGSTPTVASYHEPPSGPFTAAAFEARASAAHSIRAATLDLGSNSFNLLIADVTNEGGIRPVVREKTMLRLGSIIASHAEIPEPVCERAVEVARDLLAVSEREKVQRLLPVATAALRETRNGANLADRIGRALGTPVRILSGEEEARIIFKAFQKRVAPGSDPVLGIDLGGGSLELAVGQGERVDSEVTLPLGVARLHSELVRRDPMKRSEIRKVRTRVREALAPALDPLLAPRPVQAIATGGTIRALARLVAEHSAPRGARPGWPMELSLEKLRALTEDLLGSSHEERLAMRGMRKGRADLLPTGAIVLTTTAEELGLSGFTVSDWGLREGVMLDALA